MSNNTTTEEPIALAFEIVPADAGLELASKNSLELAFTPFFAAAEKWKSQASTITDPKLARTARLELKALRVAAEKKRKELKEDSLRMGKAIDGANNILLAVIVPIEKSLDDIEKAEERRLAAEKAALIERRMADLSPFLDPSLPAPNVGDLSEEQFARLLTDSKFLHESKVAAAKKAEEEKAAREAAEAAERAKVIAENARLKKEAEEREAKMKAEREAAEKARAEAEAKAKAEREKIEAAARAERAKVEAERKAAEEAARKEREAIEAKARAEREKAEAAARAAESARKKAEAEAKALREAEARKETERREAEERAAAAPDKEKLLRFADQIRQLKVGDLTSAKGITIRAEVDQQVEKFAAWIEKKAANL